MGTHEHIQAWTFIQTHKQLHATIHVGAYPCPLEALRHFSVEPHLNQFSMDTNEKLACQPYLAKYMRGEMLSIVHDCLQIPVCCLSNIYFPNYLLGGETRDHLYIISVCCLNDIFENLLWWCRAFSQYILQGMVQEDNSTFYFICHTEGINQVFAKLILTHFHSVIV